MIRYALYDPVGKRYNSFHWPTAESAKDFCNRMVAIYNPDRYPLSNRSTYVSKYRKEYERKRDYYKRLILRKAQIKWETVSP